MRVEGDAIVFDDDDVRGFLYSFYSDISEFLGNDPKPTRLVIPLEGATVLGLEITTVEKKDGL